MSAPDVDALGVPHARPAPSRSLRGTCALALTGLVACRGGIVSRNDPTDGGAPANDGRPTGTNVAPLPDAGAAAGTPPGAAQSPNAAASPNPPANPNAPATSAGDCAARRFAVCDDFESATAGGPPDPTLWQVETQNPTSAVQVASEQFHRGSKSLHITTANKGFERAVIVNKSFFPAPGNNVFGRAWVLFDQPIPMIHFDIVSGRGTLAGQNTLTTVNIGSQFGLFLANYYNAQDPAHVLDLWQHAGVQQNGTWSDATYVPQKRWTCLEWQYEGATNHMRMWLDGQAVERMHVAAQSPECCPGVPWTQPPFDALAVGMTVVANQEAFQGFSLWLDGVALDGARIGCEG